MAAPPQSVVRDQSHPRSVEPPPPDLFGAAAASGANVARPSNEPTTCCGRYLHFLPVIAVFICVVIAGSVNIALALGESVPFVPPLPPHAYNTTTTVEPTSTPAPTTTGAPQTDSPNSASPANAPSPLQ